MENEDLKSRLLRRVWGMGPAILLALLIVLVIALGAGIKGKRARLDAERAAALKNERPPINVVVLEARPETISETLTLPGVVEPWQRLNLVAEVSGRVVNVPVAEGMRLKGGDVIARLDARDYENARAAVGAEYDRALSELNRLEGLYQEDSIPRTRYEDAVAMEERLRAERDNADLRLERTVITAPASGILNRLDAKVGMYIAAMDPVGELLNIERVKVEVGIPESDVAAVRDIDDFEIEIDALGAEAVKGRKRFLASGPDSLAHLYKLQITVSNPRHMILPGMFARVRIVKQRVADGISVPLYAIISRDGERFVMVENEGTAETRKVETGFIDGWRILVTNGVAPGDHVVVVGHRSLGDGQAVKVIRTVSEAGELFK